MPAALRPPQTGLASAEAGDLPGTLADITVDPGALDDGGGDVCVFYYCRTYYKAVRVGGGGEWRSCAMRDDEPRPVWMSLFITH
jgi:hypothetical protein